MKRVTALLLATLMILGMAACGAKQEALACIKCGAPLQPGAKFCPQCGAKQE